MRRREFIPSLGSMIAFWPLGARAQQARKPLIGLLSTQSPEASTRQIAAFRQGLQELGYVEPDNVVIEFRWAAGQLDQLPTLARDLVGRRVDVIAATAGGGAPAALAAKNATSTIPIVFTTGVDPVKVGLVASFNRPGGNVTGIAFLSLTLDAKRLELLLELVPKVKTVAMLLNPTFPDAVRQLHEIQVASRAVRQRIALLRASNIQEIDTAFGKLAEMQAGALLVGADPFFIGRHRQIVALAARHAVPAIYEERSYTLAGGLVSYGANLRDTIRQAGVYTGRILKGEKPADLPVLQPTRLELVVNLKTANVLGLTIPAAVLTRADEIIE